VRYDLERDADRKESQAPVPAPEQGGRNISRRVAARVRTAKQGEVTEPPGRQRDCENEGDAIVQTESQTQNRGSGCAANGRAERAPSQRRDHQRQRREIEQ